VTDSGADVGVAADADASGDATACDCRVENLTLTMSWACFCAKFGCTDTEPACGPNRTTYPGCGLTADSTDPAGGPYISVWDENGALVGRQYSSDTSEYQCPSDPSQHALRVRAGRFPEASCSGVACTCTDNKTTCAAPDAGADASDGGGADAGCSGTLFFCALGSPGGQCSDVGQAAVCSNGQWTCPSGTIRTSECGCVGAPPPGCTCGSAGFSCPTDGGGP
jgi:hypothetical protein